MQKLDFYKRGDGHWDFYVNNGAGKIEGRCYSTNDEQDCLGGRIVWVDELICYSYICGE